jgi:hypothetical protein
VDVLKRVAVVGLHQRTDNGEAVEDTAADRDRKPIQVRTVAFALGETVLSDEVGGVGDETAIIAPQVLASQVVNCADLVGKLPNVAYGIATIAAEMGIAGHDLSTELSEGRGRGTVSHKAWNILPGVTLGTSVSHCPFNGILGV